MNRTQVLHLLALSKLILAERFGIEREAVHVE